MAWVFVVELVAAAAVPFDAARERQVRPAQLIAPAQGYSGAAKPLLVGDRAVRLVSLGGAATDRLLSRIASNMAAAIERVEVFWGPGWSHDITVVATGSDEQFRTAAGGGTESQWADIAAATVADHVDAAHRVAVGQRIVFAPGATRMSEDALRIVLTHELFHYAARVDTADDAPRWVTEGVADFVARPGVAIPAEARSAYQPLPSDGDLDTPGPARSLAYDRAWWFARFVAEISGAPTLRAFYLAACRVGHPDPLTAARDVLGLEPAELLTRWTQWMAGGA